MGIKTWLETAGEPVADTAFPPGDAPELPYIIFLDTTEHGGGDMRNLFHRHSLTVERYSETDDDNTALEALFDAKALKYDKERTWLPDPDDMFETIYTIKTPIIERTDT